MQGAQTLHKFPAAFVHRRSQAHPARPLSRAAVVASASADKQYDYDLVIIGCGVGGHGAALHAVEQVRLFVALSERE